MTGDTWSHGRDGVTASRYGRRRFIAVGCGVGAALLAGCTSDDGGSDGTPTDGGGSGDGDDPGSFRLLVSDAPADIDDFERLDVTFEQARVFDGGGDDEEETEDDEETETEDAQETDAEGTATAGGEENETVEEDQQQTDDQGTETKGGDDEQGTETEEGTEVETETDEEAEDADGANDEGDRGFYVLELDSPTVDLTQVVGDKAQPIFDGELEAGSYQKLELHVEDTEGVVDGEEVEVTVPSEKLQLTKPFELRAGEELDFVFDIDVVKRGNQDSYNLQPVVSESGVRGEDVEVEEVDEEGQGAGDEAEGSDDGTGSNGTDDEGGGGADDETGGNETGGNETGGNETGGNESAA